MNYCTSVDEIYLPRFRALHHSMETHCQPYTIWILALTERIEALTFPNCCIIPLKNVETDAIRATRTSRQWPEYVWTLKPALMVYLLEHAPIDNLTYIDSDGFFFSNPAPLFTEIGNAPLAITPHRLQPGYESYLINGEFNGGFIYANRSGLPCLQRWAAQCLDWCYIRHEEDRFVDQKYLNTWPEKWGAHSIEHKGVNLAPWNQAQYNYTLQDGQILVDDEPLIWYHFHQGLKPSYPIHPFVQQHIYSAYAELGV